MDVARSMVFVILCLLNSLKGFSMRGGRRRYLIHLILVGLVLPVLAGCGQKGPLYLPDKPEDKPKPESTPPSSPQL